MFVALTIPGLTAKIKRLRHSLLSGVDQALTALEQSERAVLVSAGKRLRDIATINCEAHVALFLTETGVHELLPMDRAL